MKALGVIPARMASTRLPGKPLKVIAGKTLIERVWNQAVQCTCFQEICIATDSPEIVDAAKKFGAHVIETSRDALTGSDRVSEVVKILGKQGKTFDLVANIQGDMPFIKPQVIEQVVKSLAQSDHFFGMATIATPIMERDEFERSSVVKVVLGSKSQALYFSRGQIPFPRGHPDSGSPFGLKHIGLYVFRPPTLELLSSLPQAEPEKREGLEQLRLLFHGVQIKVEVIDRELMEPSIEVDTPEDLQKANQIAMI